MEWTKQGRMNEGERMDEGEREGSAYKYNRGKITGMSKRERERDYR